MSYWWCPESEQGHRKYRVRHDRLDEWLKAAWRGQIITNQNESSLHEASCETIHPSRDWLQRLQIKPVNKQTFLQPGSSWAQAPWDNRVTEEHGFRYPLLCWGAGNRISWACLYKSGAPWPTTILNHHHAYHQTQRANCIEPLLVHHAKANMSSTLVCPAHNRRLRCKKRARKRSSGATTKILVSFSCKPFSLNPLTNRGRGKNSLPFLWPDPFWSALVNNVKHSIAFGKHSMSVSSFQLFG